MFTDIVGYTSLSQKDEDLALRLLAEHNDLLRRQFGKFGGREVKTIGDSFLVEFSNALSAVRCALAIQEAMQDSQIGAQELGQALQIRIGVHVGDVIRTKNGDILGDAVNISSRVRPLAEPGGICISQQVYDQVRNKLKDVSFVSLYAHDLKNVSEPVQIYRVIPSSKEKGKMETRAFDRKRIAILPFTNISPDPADEYFSDGLTEELISTMSKIRELKVISRTSTMLYKSKPKPLVEIGKDLGVGTILEGSVRKAGNRVRVTVQMIDAAEDDHLWSETYDREIQDVFKIQSDISEHVANALKVQLLSVEKKKLETAPTTNIEAYTLYLKGRYYWNERTKEGLEKAIQYFTEVIKRDPNYARAYAGLADCYFLLDNWGYASPADVIEKVRTYVKKALELDDSSAEAHVSNGAILVGYEWNMVEAEREMKRAIELNPNYATAHHWYGNGILTPLGRFEEARYELLEAKKLDPLSAIIGSNIGDSLLFAREYKEAVAQYRSVLEVSPNFAYAHSRLGLALLGLAEYDEAISEIQKAGELASDYFGFTPDLIFAYAASGRRVEGEKLVAEFEAKATEKYVSSTSLALANASIGRNEKAIEWLRKEVAEHSNSLHMNFNEPHFDNLRSDPRFEDIFRMVHGRKKT